MADLERLRKQKERETLAREEREREEYRRREDKRRIERQHEDEKRRWTDMAVKMQQQNKAKDIAEAEEKRLQIIKRLEEKKKNK